MAWPRRIVFAFPVDEPPDLELKAEIEAAKAIRCPMHGERFSRPAPYVYRASHSIRPVHLQLENCLDWHSPQYLKALKASAATEITEPDGTVRFLLKNGVEVHRIGPPTEV